MPVASFTITKLAWFLEHERDLGAAAQATAILSAESVDQIAQPWALGTGDTFEPDGAPAADPPHRSGWALGTGDTFEPDPPTGHRALRARYRDARDRLFPA